jgi:hypothetical protein
MDEINENQYREGAIATQDPEPSNPDQIRKRQDQALMFEKYIDESGLSLSFQIIFTEIIQKQIPED